MLTNQIDGKTFIAAGVTYNAGDTIQLEIDENRLLQHVGKESQALEKYRNELFRTLFTTTSNADETLAKEFFQYETRRINWQYELTTLVRRVCSRLCGLIPMHVDKVPGSEELRLVVSDLTEGGQSVVLTVDGIRQATQFNQFIGDLRYFGAFIAGPTFAAGKDNLVAIDPPSWSSVGCPYLIVRNHGLSVDYAKDFTDFKWADHEHKFVDRKISTALANLLSVPGRFLALQQNRMPLAFIAGVVSDNELALFNLSAASVNTDTFRIETLRKVAHTRNTSLVFLLQFGPLKKDGSTHDFGVDAPVSQPIMGITLTLVIKTDSGPIVGSKSWTFVAEPNGEPAMKIFAAFENQAGLSSDSATDILKSLILTPAAARA